jgi:hypothetical protein
MNRNQIEFTIVRLACAAIVALGVSILAACGGNDPAAQDDQDQNACMSFDGKPVECTAASGASHG